MPPAASASAAGGWRSSWRWQPLGRVPRVLDGNGAAHQPPRARLALESALPALAVLAAVRLGATMPPM